MKDKIKVAGVFLLVYMALAGSVIEEYLDSPATAYLYGLLALIETSIILMIVPFIIKRIWGKKMTKRKWFKVCMWNSIGVIIALAVIDILILGGFYDQNAQNIGSNSVFALAYFYINLKLFPKNGIKNTEI